VPKLTDVKVIDYDFAKYGASDTRRRLLERWEKEVGNAAR
jgi:iron(III) transport system substrate-binding protein